VDLIVLATSTPDMVFPSSACLLQAKLGVKKGAAFDVQAVCSGFVYALATADLFIRSGQHKCALVVGAEVFSRILDWKDRGTCVLFGDGAGAVVLEASDEPGILSSHLRADGSYASILNTPGHVSGGAVQGDPTLKMDGGAVFKLAVRVLEESAREALAANNYTVADLDIYIPHQANVRIVSHVGKKLGLPESKCIVTVDRHANTSAASIPLALDVAVRDGRVKQGHLVLLQGVGGGFTWGSVLLRY
jgi:3-oxoacyl-[acyl-carrier-protein] synthase-3